MLEYIATVDIGSHAHSVALFDANEKFITKVNFNEMPNLVKSHQISTTNTFGIVSSIKDSNLQDIPFKHQLARRLLLHGKFRDMPVSYAETIHDTRLVNAYFLYKLNHQKKLIIDCNESVFVDYVDQSGFKGGYILPGLSSLRDIFKYNEQFKFFVQQESLNFALTNSLPQNNNVAIEQGILTSFYFSIKGILKQLEPQSIFLTGAYAEEVASFLKETCQKNNISMQLNKDLIHRSLCFIAKRVAR